MARNLTPSNSPDGDKEFGVMPDSPASPPSKHTGPSPFSNVFNPSGYEHLKAEDGEDIGSPKIDDLLSSPQASTNTLGIFPDIKERASSVKKVPFSPKSPETNSSTAVASPDSTSGLLDSPPSSTGKPAKSSIWSRLRDSVQNGWPWGEGLDAKSKDTFDDELFIKKHSEPPTFCRSKEDISQSRSKIMILASIYSTAMSAAWVIVSFKQPRWGEKISSNKGLSPSTASVIATIVAKSIELSSVAVFAWCVGQQLTRRAYNKGRGLTLAEITMRGWINQPGAWFRNYETVRYSWRSMFTPLTIAMILATIGATFYTPASDAMVSPKLKFHATWQQQSLKGPVHSSYGSNAYARSLCPAMLAEAASYSKEDDSCISVQFSGQSYRNLLGFMNTWTNLFDNGTALSTQLAGRPAGTHLLYDNVTMEGAWIETQHSDVAANSEKYGRIVNNVTMAMPHPGVYKAAKWPGNRILQPDDLNGIGQYAIRAGVVSPAINVLCVSASAEELAPLVYTTWPNSNITNSTIGQQKVPLKETDWIYDIPPMFYPNMTVQYYNRTVLDEVFKWGPEYYRRRPIFSTFPNDNNFISNATVNNSTGIYTLAKRPNMQNYTLCEARSWTSPACSTFFNVSGTQGSKLGVNCEDPNDEFAYHRSFAKDQGWSLPSMDWRDVGHQWQLSMDMNGGQRNSNSSNGHIVSRTALMQPVLPAHLPSMAEVWAVYLGSTLVLGSIDTPFRHYWEYAVPGNMLKEAAYQEFNATLVSQEYTSGHDVLWKAIVFYPVLIIVFVINVLCFFYLWRSGTVTDFTEPGNLFALAINSPPSTQFNGSCGGGPKKRDFVVPWRVAYAQQAHHYFFAEANDHPWKGKYSATGKLSGGDVEEQGADYKRLSGKQVWL